MSDGAKKTRADLSPEDIAEIRSRELSQRAYAEMFGVSKREIEVVQRKKKYDYVF